MQIDEENREIKIKLIAKNAEKIKCLKFKSGWHLQKIPFTQVDGIFFFLSFGFVVKWKDKGKEKRKFRVGFRGFSYFFRVFVYKNAGAVYTENSNGEGLLRSNVMRKREV